MARIRKHFETNDDGSINRVEVDYFDPDTEVYLEVLTDLDSEDGESALVILSPKKAEKIGRALIKAAAEARKAKRGNS